MKMHNAHGIKIESKLLFSNIVQILGNRNIDGLVQERRNSSALAMELCLSCTNPSIRRSVN